MDPNLQKIKESNLRYIKRGHIKTAILQAENYLLYIMGFNHEKIKQELSKFVFNIKKVRKNHGKT